MPPVQIHVACLYHHDVHGWWTTKGLWDVHMLRARSTRPSQSLLGGTKRRSLLGTMPWPRITSMTLEANSGRIFFKSEEIEKPTWLVSELHSWVFKNLQKSPCYDLMQGSQTSVASQSQVAILSSQSSTTPWAVGFSSGAFNGDCKVTSEKCPAKIKAAEMEVFVSYRTSLNPLFFCDVQAIFCFCKEGCQTTQYKIVQPAACRNFPRQNHEQKQWNSVVYHVLPKTDHPLFRAEQFLASIKNEAFQGGTMRNQAQHFTGLWPLWHRSPCGILTATCLRPAKAFGLAADSPLNAPMASRATPDYTKGPRERLQGVIFGVAAAKDPKNAVKPL